MDVAHARKRRRRLEPIQAHASKTGAVRHDELSDRCAALFIPAHTIESALHDAMQARDQSPVSSSQMIGVCVCVCVCVCAVCMCVCKRVLVCVCVCVFSVYLYVCTFVYVCV